MIKVLSRTFLGIIFFLALTVNAGTQVDLDKFSFKNAKYPFANIITGGQPSLNDLIELKSAGVKNVINLRMSREFSELSSFSIFIEAGICISIFLLCFNDRFFCV